MLSLLLKPELTATRTKWTRCHFCDGKGRRCIPAVYTSHMERLRNLHVWFSCCLREREREDARREGDGKGEPEIVDRGLVHICSLVRGRRHRSRGKVHICWVFVRPYRAWAAEKAVDWLWRQRHQHWWTVVLQLFRKSHGWTGLRREYINNMLRVARWCPKVDRFGEKLMWHRSVRS